MATAIDSLSKSCVALWMVARDCITTSSCFANHHGQHRQIYSYSSFAFQLAGLQSDNVTCENKYDVILYLGTEYSESITITTN